MGGWGKGFVMALKETFPRDSLDKHYRRWHKARTSDRRQQPQEGSAAAAPVVSGSPQQEVAAAQGRPAPAAASAELGSKDAPAVEEAPVAAATAAELGSKGFPAVQEAPEAFAEQTSEPQATAAVLAANDASAEEAEPWQEPFRLGAVQFLPTSNVLIEVANMIAQHGIKSSRRRGEVWDKIDYAALEEALDKVGRFAAMRAASVHMPKIGSGLAGGDWERIEQAIEAILLERHGVNVWVYIQ